MSNIAIVALRAVIVVIALGVLLSQTVVIPVLATMLADRSHREVLAIVYAVSAVAVGACVEVVLVALWVLLSKVRRGAIFSETSFRWVDLIIGAGGAATAIVVSVGAHIVLVVEPEMDAPGLDLLVIAAVVAATAFVLLMVVMRGLLRSATTLQSELAEVV